MSTKVKINKVNNFYSYTGNVNDLQEYDYSDYDSCKKKLGISKVNNKTISRKLNKIKKKVNQKWQEDDSFLLDLSEVDNYNTDEE